MSASTITDRASPIPLLQAAPLRVMVVEQTGTASNPLSTALQAAGLAVESAGDGREAMARKLYFQPDIVLIDLGVPGLEGLTLVERFAREGDCGVIVVSADTGETARVAGLDIGADDCVGKPPPIRELLARMRALHRRLLRGAPAQGPARPPRVTLELASRCLNGPGRARTLLTEAEYAALETLLDADGASVSREWLGRVALRRQLRDDDRSVDQLVLKLRRKLTLHGVVGRVILSSRGLGYVIPEPERFRVESASAGDGAGSA